MRDSYTRVLESVIAHGDERVASEALHKLIAHLRSTGRLKLLTQILQELKKTLSRRATHTTRLEVAHEREKATALAAVRTVGVHPEHVQVNPSLIQGWRVRSKDFLLDQSAKHALLTIYQRVTH